MTAPRTRRLWRLVALVLAMATAPQLALVPVGIAFGVPVNVLGLVIDSSILELIVGLVIVGGAVAARKSKNAAGQRAPMIGGGAAIFAYVIGGVLILVAVFTFTPMTAQGPAGGTPGATALSAIITPSVDTTASLPGAPYTACTSLVLGAVTKTGAGAGTSTGAVWTASDATYTANAGGYAAGGTFLERDAVARAKWGTTFNTAECFQMAFGWQYTPSPINSVGQTFKAPVMIDIQSISYTTLLYNNATLINAPVVAQQPLVNGRQDWSMLVLTGASVWIPACPGAGSTNPLSVSACTPQQVDVNDGTTTDTIKLSVIINVNGPFGYDQATSPIGKQWVVQFALGLPQGTSGAQNNYMNWVPYTLIVQATS